MAVYRLNKDLIFPDPILADPEGLLAVGGDLSVERLLLAYSMGIFPWYSDGQPILWWSPDPRLILYPDQIKISKSLKRNINKYEIKYDQQFRNVMLNCSEISRPGQDGTWITDQMIEAYCILHIKGFAHSVEAYLDGELVGGLYGISLGNAFFGESMFAKEPDASKVALVNLAEKLVEWEFDFIDCQVTTDHLLRMGAVEIPRSEFLSGLNNALRLPTRVGNWN